MSLKENSKKSSNPIAFYIAALVVAAAGITLLITNIVIFNRTVSQYVAQGYTKASVVKEMIPQQLIPDICNDLGIFGGIAAILVGIGFIYGKSAKNTADDAEIETSSIEEDTSFDDYIYGNKNEEEKTDAEDKEEDKKEEKTEE